MWNLNVQNHTQMKKRRDKKLWQSSGVTVEFPTAEIPPVAYSLETV